MLLATRPQVNRAVTVNSRLANRAVNRAFLQPALRTFEGGLQSLYDGDDALSWLEASANTDHTGGMNERVGITPG